MEQEFETWYNSSQIKNGYELVRFNSEAHRKSVFKDIFMSGIKNALTDVLEKLEIGYDNKTHVAVVIEDIKHKISKL